MEFYESRYCSFKCTHTIERILLMEQSWNRAVIFQPDPNPIPVVRNPTRTRQVK